MNRTFYTLHQRIPTKYKKTVTRIVHLFRDRCEGPLKRKFDLQYNSMFIVNGEYTPLNQIGRDMDSIKIK